MPEEAAAVSVTESMEEKPCSSSAPVSSIDVAEEAKKLIGTGNRHLVMGDVVSAVTVFQEACAMLAERYGDTADECGEAFFLCGKSLLELARMENSVLGNALEGVPEESSEEGEKQNDSKIESADNLDDKTRDELREQVYDALSEENRDSKEGADKEVMAEDAKGQKAADDAKEVPVERSHEALVPNENSKSCLGNEEMQLGYPMKREEKAAENGVEEVVNEKTADEVDGVTESKPAEIAVQHVVEEKVVENAELKQEEKQSVAEKENSEQEMEHPEEQGITDKAVPMEEEAGDDGDEDDDDDDNEEDESSAEAKENEEEVGNLQLAWEMLEVAKVIYKRKESVDDQLMAAQIFLKLGEVGAESGNYSQALDDFQECLAIQLKHLPAHSRLLAETHYQLGTTFSYTSQYSQAIQHFTSSIKVIESRLAVIQEAIDKAEGEKATKEEKCELEELKLLLPEIAEKVEDAKESQRSAAAASEAILQTLGGATTSSGFPAENGSSTSTASQIDTKPSEVATSSKSASDISHLVRKKRKPEDESPKKDSEAKKVKQETTVNGSGDTASNSNGVQEKMEQEAVNPPTSAETSA